MRIKMTTGTYIDKYDRITSRQERKLHCIVLKLSYRSNLLKDVGTMCPLGSHLYVLQLSCTIPPTLTQFPLKSWQSKVQWKQMSNTFYSITQCKHFIDVWFIFCHVFFFICIFSSVWYENYAWFVILRTRIKGMIFKVQPC